MGFYSKYLTIQKVTGLASNKNQKLLKLSTKKSRVYYNYICGT